MVSLETTVADIPLSTCIYDASGPRTGTSEALSKIASSQSGAVLAKSATMLKQSGNPLPRTWQSSEASLNSEGLPNNGIEYYLSAQTIEDTIGQSGKPYMVSISGKTLNDNVAMIERTITANKVLGGKIACLELNLACPNIIGKPIIAYDFDQMRTVLAKIATIPDIASLKLGVKMPPYFDGPHFVAAAEVLNDYKHIVKYVASINTVGNALVIDSIGETPVISSNRGFAGLSGKAVKYTALANVRQMRGLLDESIDVVGVGGVETGEDAFELILCGAAAVQVGTCHWREGASCFDRICDELREIMKKKGYTNIKDFRGKLKDWSKEQAALTRAVKKSRKTVEEKGQSVKVGAQDPMNMIVAILVVVVAALLADKFGVVSL